MLCLPHSLSWATSRRFLSVCVIASKSSVKVPIMSSPIQNRLASYDASIKNLNSLQSAPELQPEILKKRLANPSLNLLATMQMLNKIGMSAQNLDSLRTIHITGTKGKGSTSALLESILRRKGLKTGLFTSPHLVSATERIQINGQPISQEKFSFYCDRIFEDIVVDAAAEDRPAYFQFLTIMAFYIFYHENVDIAIIEVGIGGEYDNTNVLRNPMFCAITSLGLDHTNILGDTIEKIAWQKAGIMKRDAITIMDYEIPRSPRKILEQRAKERNAFLYEAPPLEKYDWGPFPKMHLSLAGEVQRKNASIALQLARGVVSKLNGSQDFHPGAPFKLDLEEAVGLRLAAWPGRSQIVGFEDTTFYLDGAHTKESMEACRSWFESKMHDICDHDPYFHIANGNRICEPLKNGNEDEHFKVLLFTVTKDRKASEMLAELSKIDFDMAIFCTSLSRRVRESDNSNTQASRVNQHVERIQGYLDYWTTTLGSSCPGFVIPFVNDALAWIAKGRSVKLHSQKIGLVDLKPPAFKFPEEALDKHVHILVTGSLHLVGGVLEEIWPKVFEKTPEDLRREEKILQQYIMLDKQSQLIREGRNFFADVQ